MSGGGGSQKVTQETKATPWAGVQPYLTSMYGMAGSQMARPMNFYPGNTTAPMSPLTGEGQGELYGFARGVMPEYLQSGDEGLRAMFGAADVANNPYVNQMLDAQARNVGDQLTRQWLPGIRQGASLAGQTGSTRQGVAEGVAIGDAAKALADATAQTQLNAYGQGLQQRTAAMAALPQMAQLGMLPGQTMQGLGQQQEGYLQNQIDEAIRRFDYYQAEPWQRLNYANAIYSGIPWNTQTQSSGGGGSSVANTLGSAMMLGSLGKGLFSSLPMAAAQQAFSPWAPAAGWGAMGSTPFAQAGAAMGMQSPAAFLSGTAAAAPALAGLGTAGAGLSLGGMESLLSFAPLLI